MAFDFFNEGIKKQSGVEFTKEQEDFFNSKLLFLDPKKTSQIPIGTVISLFNLTKINSAIIKKILQNCKVEGKKFLTYEQMKKVFRGISLAQKGIEPSNININANIKLPMPKFYDDDDEEEEEEQAVKHNPVQQQKPSQVQLQVPQVQVQVPPKSPANSQKEPSFAEFGQFVQPPKQTQQPQKQQQSAKLSSQPQKPTVQQEQHETSSNKFKQFEAYWSKLNTHNNKIDGGQVKSLCKFLAQRSNLSKAWKLCCHTHSGSLTKGQFYVFLELVGLPHLPESLGDEMKSIISKIDKGLQNGKQKERNVSQLSTSQAFDNFGKSQLSINAPPALQKPSNQPSAHKSATFLAEATSKFSNKIEGASKSFQSLKEASQQQLLQLRRQQQAINNMMGQVEQFLLQVNNKTNNMKAQIDQLKSNQMALNERFSKICLGMNQIILRQNSLIDELTHELAQQNKINDEKANLLQKYVADREAHSLQVQEMHRRSQEREVNPQERHSEEERPSLKRYAQKSGQKQPQIVQNKQSPSPKYPVSPQITEPEQQCSPSPPAEHHQQSQSRKEDPQEQLRKEQEEYMNRMRMKQMQVIQLIHYLTPISQEEYPKIAQKITAYSEDQLNFAYSGLYEKLLKKQKLEEQAAEKSQKNEAVRSSITGEDQFNTSNFKHGEKQQHREGEDFFS